MKKNNYLGKFIVFEGLDGSGQSTQAALLAEFLNQHGIVTLLTKEPTDTALGRFIYSILEEKIKISPMALQLLFVADRINHLDQQIIPALQNGQWIISDRYFFTTLAYGANIAPLALEYLIRVNDFLMPDLVFLLKVRPEICLSRIDKRGLGHHLFEKKDRMDKNWRGYEEVLKRFPEINLINGEQTIEKVFEDIKIITEKFMKEVK